MAAITYQLKTVPVGDGVGVLLPPHLIAKLDPTSKGKIGWEWVGERTLALRPVTGGQTRS